MVSVFLYPVFLTISNYPFMAVWCHRMPISSIHLIYEMRLIKFKILHLKRFLKKKKNRLCIWKFDRQLNKKNLKILKVIAILHQISEYLDSQFLLPTSNLLERFFSTEYAYSDLRQSLLPQNLEMQLFLKVNKNYWGHEFVSKIVSEKWCDN